MRLVLFLEMEEREKVFERAKKKSIGELKVEPESYYIEEVEESEESRGSDKSEEPEDTEDLGERENYNNDEE